MICNLGFYQKIRNEITNRWMGLKDPTKQTKNKVKCIFYFFIFIPTHPNGPKLGRQEHLHPHCFIQDHHQNHLEGCCQCNLFHSVLLRGFGNFPGCSEWIYRRYYDLISKFQVGLKSLLRQGLWEPDFYGDLVYKLKNIVGSNNFSAEFIKIISHYKKIGYNINVLQQTACLVVNPITVGNFAFLFNCTPVGRTSDSMMVPT